MDATTSCCCFLSWEEKRQETGDFGGKIYGFPAWKHQADVLKTIGEKDKDGTKPVVFNVCQESPWRDDLSARQVGSHSNETWLSSHLMPCHAMPESRLKPLAEELRVRWRWRARSGVWRRMESLFVVLPSWSIQAPANRDQHSLQVHHLWRRRRTHLDLWFRV